MHNLEKIYRSAIFNIYARIPLSHMFLIIQAATNLECLNTLIIPKLPQSLQIPVHPLPMCLMQ